MNLFSLLFKVYKYLVNGKRYVQMVLKHTSKIYTISIFLMGLISSFCDGQNLIRHYTSQDGLAHDVTYNLFQDGQGYIWICTDDGLSRFDGRVFKNYGPTNGFTNNFVMDVEEISNEHYVVSTWGGGLHFLENDTIKKYAWFKDEDRKIENLIIHDSTVYTDSGSISTSYDLRTNTAKNYYYSSSEGFKTYSNEVNNLLLTKTVIIDDTKFIIDRESFVDDFKGVKMISDNGRAKTVFEYLNTVNVGDIVMIGQNEFLFGHNNYLIFGDYNGLHEKIEVTSIPDFERIIKLIKSPKKKGAFLVLTRNKSGFKKLYTFNKHTKESRSLEVDLNMNASVSDIMFDFEGNLWISTFGNGIFSFNFSDQEVTTLLDGVHIVDMVSLGREVFILSPSILFQFEDEKPVKSLKLDGFAKALNIHNDTLFLSVLGGNTKLSFKNIKILNGRFHGICKHGKIRQTDTLFLNDLPIHIGNEMVVRSIRDKGNSLEFFTTKGKWRYLPKTKEFYLDSTFLLSNKINRFHKVIHKSDSILFLTNEGFYVQHAHRLTKFGYIDGLINESINDIFIENGIYLATQGGLSLIRDGEILNYSKSIGFNSLAINSILSVQENLWLGGDNGISIVKKKDFTKSTPPKIIIAQNDTKFKFTAISFEGLELFNSFRLNGGEWKPLGTAAEPIDFSNYAYGNYSVEFRSRKSHSNWTYSEKFVFQISPPWYKTWWIIALLFISMLGIGAILFFNRLSTVTKRNENLKQEIRRRISAENELSQVRNNIARDFHDDLGNKLASISLLSDVLINKVDSTGTHILKTIKNDADYLYKGTKDFIFSLQDKSNYLNELSIYLIDFAENYLHQFGISFQMKAELNNSVKLPHYWSKQIIYIFKEAITNTAKHSKANNAYINFSNHKLTLCITYEDDGIGFNTGPTGNGGLQNMISRATKIGCVLDISSELGKGTKIIFSGELPN